MSDLVGDLLFRPNKLNTESLCRRAPVASERWYRAGQHPDRKPEYSDVKNKAFELGFDKQMLYKSLVLSQKIEITSHGPFLETFWRLCGRMRLQNDTSKQS